MNTPIDMREEHGGEYESDERQYRVLGLLSVTFGGFITVLALLPNTIGGRAGLAVCGASIAAVGAFLLVLARRAAAQHASEVTRDEAEPALVRRGPLTFNTCESTHGTFPHRHLPCRRLPLRCPRVGRCRAGGRAQLRGCQVGVRARARRRKERRD